VFAHADDYRGKNFHFFQQLSYRTVLAPSFISSGPTSVPPPRITFDRIKTREVFLWIKKTAFDMLEKLGDDGLYMTAWRSAARTRLHHRRQRSKSGTLLFFRLLL